MENRFYEAPQVEIVEVEVEKGFAVSSAIDDIFNNNVDE